MVFYGRFLRISMVAMATAIIIATVAPKMYIGMLSGAASGVAGACGAAVTPKAACPDEL